MSFAAVSDREIIDLLAHPEGVHKVLDWEYDVEPKEKNSFFGKLFGKPSQARIAKPLPGPTGISPVDIDKAWHLIHLLLTGNAFEGDPPLNFILYGGEEVGDIDVGYGPARAIGAAGAAEIAMALRAVSDEELRVKFDPVAASEDGIYQNLRPGDDPNEALDYIFSNLATLRKFIDDVTSANLGFLIWLA